MTQIQWTQRALAVLEREGLIVTGLVNIAHGPEGCYTLEVGDHDGDVHALTVRTIT